MKLDLLTDAKLVSNAAKFVEKHKQSDKDDNNNDNNDNDKLQYNSTYTKQY